MSKQASKGGKSSVTYRWVPLDLTCLGPADLAPTKGAQAGCSSCINSIPANGCSHTNCSSENAASCSNQIVTTPELTSTMGRLWKAVIQPLDASQPKACTEMLNIVQEEKTVGYPGNETSQRTFTSLHSELLYDKKSIGCSTLTAKLNYQYLNTIKRILLFDPFMEFSSISFQGILEVPQFHKYMGFKFLAGARGTGLAQHLVPSGGSVNHHIKGQSSFSKIKPKLAAEVCNLGKGASVSNISATPMVNTHLNSAENRNSPTAISREGHYTGNTKDVTYSKYSSKKEAESVGKNFEQPLTSVCFAPATSVVGPATISSCQSVDPYSDYGVRFLSSINCTCQECRQKPDSCNRTLISSGESVANEKSAHGGKKNLCYEPVIYGRSFPNRLFLLQNKVEDAFLKGKHAVAGGLAGIFVSLCLHPVDTVKTVIQAQGCNQKPILRTLESIISERGVVGLYRGVASNIASSAPISAVYTFTYESVKGALLPLLPTGYHSLAHCTAGGCASIATSFIFTPSERVKQQMQVHSCYTNCWNALVGVVERGGLPSLYAGWGAVLCRNVPHSIIKFYMYEHLKQLLRQSTERDAHISTLQTLVCGGLAGSTAALFTTPFDVVKTRLQVQVPGSLRKYDGVFHAFKEIVKHEGVHGLYRGLTPRLLMYVSQGAIFFASYEFLKTILSVERVGSVSGVVNKKP